MLMAPPTLSQLRIVLFVTLTVVVPAPWFTTSMPSPPPDPTVTPLPIVLLWIVAFRNPVTVEETKLTWIEAGTALVMLLFWMVVLLCVAPDGLMVMPLPRAVVGAGSVNVLPSIVVFHVPVADAAGATWMWSPRFLEN